MRRLFDRIQRKRLGVTQDEIESILLAMDAEAPIDDEPSEVLAAEVMLRLRAKNEEAWCKAHEAKFDFDGLLEFISKIIQMLMPFIIKKRQPTTITTG